MAVIAAVAALLLEFGAWTRTGTLQAPFIADGGHAFRIELDPGPVLRNLLSTGGDGSRNYSRLRLFEDGIELTADHAAHQLIRDIGGGRYSHWHDALYFSATDNSDPNVSGHIYSAVYSLRVQSWVWMTLAAALLLSLLLHRREIQAIQGKIRPLLLKGQGSRTAVAIQFLLLTFFVAVPVSVVAILLASGQTSSQAIGGLLPWSDSGGWLYGAFRVLLGGEASEWAARRPLNTVFLAAVLGAAGQQLVGALLIRAALLGVTVYLFFRVTAHSFGVVAALAGACIIYGFAYPFLGVALSEINGLIFGTLGISILLHATHSRSSRWFGLGLFLLAIGLLIRSGPFFVLPALAVWSAFVFSEGRRPAFRPFFISIAAIAGAWLLSKGLALAYMPPGVLDNANFSYVFYGLAKGGESWRAFCSDMQAVDPQYCAHRLERDLAKEAYGRAFDLIMANPMPLLRGMSGFVLDFLKQLGIYAPPTVRAVLLAVAAVGFLVAVFSRDKPERRLPLVGFIGSLASASLIYWSVDAHRAYAATIAFDALFVAFGVCALLRIVFGVEFVKESGAPLSAPSGDWRFRPVAIAGLLGVSLVMFMALGPAVLRAEAVSTAVSSVGSCSGDEREVIARLGRSSTYIRLSDGSDTFAPDVDYAAFRRDPDFAGIAIAEFLNSFRVGDLFMIAIDLGGAGYEYFWTHAGGGLNLMGGKLYRLCIRHASSDIEGYAPYLYEVASAQEIEEAR